MEWVKAVVLYSLLWCSLLAMPVAEGSTNPCFLSLSKNSNQCQQYRYDTLNVYFRDEFNVEHKAITERVISKASGALAHANYDFEVQCHNRLDCANLELTTETVLWAFRNAIVENRLYEVIYEPCDPNMEHCCGDLSCQQALGEGDESKTMLTSAASNKDNARRTERATQNSAAVTTTVDTLSRDAKTTSNYKNDFAQLVSPNMLLFALREINTDSSRVCTLGIAENGYALCTEIEGRIVDSAGNGYVELAHSGGVTLQRELSDFLLQFFVHDRGMNCSQTLHCSMEGNCNVAMKCE